MRSIVGVAFAAVMVAIALAGVAFDGRPFADVTVWSWGFGLGIPAAVFGVGYLVADDQ